MTQVNTNENRSTFQTWIVFGSFLSLALVFVFLKGLSPPISERLADFDSEVASNFQFVCTEIHTCMRIGASFVQFLFFLLFNEIANFLFINPETSELLPRSPWGMFSHSLHEKAVAAKLIAFILVRLIFLLPVFFLVRLYFKGVIAPVLVLLFVFLALSGWSSFVLDSFFAFITFVTMSDWPKSFWIFGQKALLYDFASLGFNCLLAIYIAHREQKKIWEIMALTALGQVIFENNGIVSGIAFFSAALMMKESVPGQPRFKVASRRLIYAGLTSLLLAMVFILYYYFNNTHSVSSLDSPASVVPDYFAAYWRDYGQLNLNWLNVTIANLLSYIGLPAFFGCMVGSVVGMINWRNAGRDIERALSDGLASLSVSIGFGVTVGIGFFVSGLGSEMGRQLLPLVLLSMLTMTKLAEMAAYYVILKLKTA